MDGPGARTMDSSILPVPVCFLTRLDDDSGQLGEQSERPEQVLVDSFLRIIQFVHGSPPR